MNFIQYGNLGWMQDRMSGMIGILVVLAMVDVALKGWGMWRAARMNKLPWFIALLVFNTLGILPAVFLLMTATEYREWLQGKGKTNV